MAAISLDPGRKAEILADPAKIQNLDTRLQERRVTLFIPSSDVMETERAQAYSIQPNREFAEISKIQYQIMPINPDADILSAAVQSMTLQLRKGQPVQIIKLEKPVAESASAGSKALIDQAFLVSMAWEKTLGQPAGLQAINVAPSDKGRFPGFVQEEDDPLKPLPPFSQPRNMFLSPQAIEEKEQSLADILQHFPNSCHAEPLSEDEPDLPPPPYSSPEKDFNRVKYPDLNIEPRPNPEIKIENTEISKSEEPKPAPRKKSRTPAKRPSLAKALSKALFKLICCDLPKAIGKGLKTVFWDMPKTFLNWLFTAAAKNSG